MDRRPYRAILLALIILLATTQTAHAWTDHPWSGRWRYPGAYAWTAHAWPLGGLGDRYAPPGSLWLGYDWTRGTHAAGSHPGWRLTTNAFGGPAPAPVTETVTALRPEAYDGPGSAESYLLYAWLSQQMIGSPGSATEAGESYVTVHGGSPDVTWHRTPGGFHEAVNPAWTVARVAFGWSGCGQTFLWRADYQAILAGGASYSYTATGTATSTPVPPSLTIGYPVSGWKRYPSQAGWTFDLRPVGLGQSGESTYTPIVAEYLASGLPTLTTAWPDTSVELPRDPAFVPLPTSGASGSVEASTIPGWAPSWAMQGIDWLRGALEALAARLTPLLWPLEAVELL